MRDIPVQTVLSGLKKIVDVAIDTQASYLFVVEQIDEATGKTKVMRYPISVYLKRRSVDTSNDTYPLVSVNATAGVKVFKGKVVSITVDEDQSILYLADAQNEKISSINYS